MASENELIANELIEYNSNNKKVIDDYKRKQSWRHAKHVMEQASTKGACPVSDAIAKATLQGWTIPDTTLT